MEAISFGIRIKVEHRNLAGRQMNRPSRDAKRRRSTRLKKPDKNYITVTKAERQKYAHC